jgi:hypothetical protein
MFNRIGLSEAYSVFNFLLEALPDIAVLQYRTPLRQSAKLQDLKAVIDVLMSDPATSRDPATIETYKNCVSEFSHQERFVCRFQVYEDALFRIETTVEK